MGYDTYRQGQVYVHPPLTPEQQAWFKDNDEERNEGQLGFPGYYLAYTVETVEVNHAVRTCIIPDESTRSYEWMEQLAWILQNKLNPGQTANGDIYWDGEETEDMGVLRVRNNKVDAQPVVMEYPGGPDYEPPPPNAVRDRWTA
jgi:hypothetical protein